MSSPVRTPRFVRFVHALVVSMGASLAVPSAAAAATDVALLPPLVLGVGDADAQAALAQRVLDASRTVLPGAPALPLVATCDPTVEARCLAKQLEGLPVEVAAQISVERGAHAWLLRLRVFGKDGQIVDERRVPTHAEDVGRATRDVLVAAFDAARHTGRIQLIGVGDGAVRVDGEPVTVRRTPQGDASEAIVDDVRTGRHAVEVEGAFSSTQRFEVEVEFDRTTELVLGDVPPPVASNGTESATAAAPSPSPSPSPSPAPAPAPAAAAPSAFPVAPIAVGGVVTGLTSLAGSLVLFVVADTNREEWRRRAAGRTFPRNSDDPQCAPSCVDTTGEQVGWTDGYGPLGATAQVGQGARFMMVAYSRDNELRWRGSQDLAVTLGVIGGLLTVGCSAILVVDVADVDEDAGNAGP